MNRHVVVPYVRLTTLHELVDQHEDHLAHPVVRRGKCHVTNLVLPTYTENLPRNPAAPLVYRKY